MHVAGENWKFVNADFILQPVNWTDNPLPMLAHHKSLLRLTMKSTASELMNSLIQFFIAVATYDAKSVTHSAFLKLEPVLKEH